MIAFWRMIQDDQLFWLGLSTGMLAGVLLMEAMGKLILWIDKRAAEMEAELEKIRAKGGK